MKHCSPALYREYLESLSHASPESRSQVADGRIGVIELPSTTFCYSPEAIYTFATAATENEQSGRRLLFIRIDRRHPDPNGAEPDFCIPSAFADASERERLRWTIDFPGSWSDAIEEALLVFEDDWAPWFAALQDGVAFTSPGASSACLLPFHERHGKAIREFSSR